MRRSRHCLRRGQPHRRDLPDRPRRLSSHSTESGALPTNSAAIAWRCSRSPRSGAPPCFSQLTRVPPRMRWRSAPPSPPPPLAAPMFPISRRRSLNPRARSTLKPTRRAASVDWRRSSISNEPSPDQVFLINPRFLQVGPSNPPPIRARSMPLIRAHSANRTARKSQVCSTKAIARPAIAPGLQECDARLMCSMDTSVWARARVFGCLRAKIPLHALSVFSTRRPTPPAPNLSISALRQARADWELRAHCSALGCARAHKRALPRCHWQWTHRTNLRENSTQQAVFALPPRASLWCVRLPAHGPDVDRNLIARRVQHEARIDRSIDGSMAPSLPSRSQPNLHASCQGQLLVKPPRFFASHFVQPASSAIYPQTFRYRSVGMENITQTACFKAFPLRTPHKCSASRLQKVDLGLDCRLPAGTRVFVVS